MHTQKLKCMHKEIFSHASLKRMYLLLCIISDEMEHGGGITGSH
jgi:hypothetical protein